MEKLGKRNIYLWHFISMFIWAILALIATALIISYGRTGHEVSFLNLLILSLAIFRLIHLFVYDSVTDFIRDYFSKIKTGFGKSTSQLINCPWCTGVWMALLIEFFYFLTPISWYIILIIALPALGSIIQIIAIYIIRITPPRQKSF